MPRSSVVLGCSYSSSIEIANYRGFCQKCGAFFFTLMIMLIGIAAAFGSILQDQYMCPLLALYDPWFLYRYAVPIAGGITAFVALIGLCFLLSQIRCLICLYIFLALLMTCLKIAGLTMLLRVYPTEKTFGDWLQKKVEHREFDNLQRAYKCCGAKDAADYKFIKLQRRMGYEDEEKDSATEKTLTTTNNVTTEAVIVNKVTKGNTAKEILSGVMEPEDGENKQVETKTYTLRRKMKTHINRTPIPVQDLLRHRNVKNDVIMVDPQDMMLSDAKAEVVLSPIMFLVGRTRNTKDQPKLLQMPDSCCAKPPCNHLSAYPGCTEIVYNYLESYKIILCAVIGGVIFFELLSALYCICVWRELGEEDKRRRM